MGSVFARGELTPEERACVALSGPAGWGAGSASSASASRWVFAEG